MKNLVLVVIFSLCLLNCQKSESDSPSSDLKIFFNSLPAAKAYDNQGSYQLLIDTVNPDPKAYYHVSGRLFFQQRLLWRADSTYAIGVTGDNDVVFVQDVIAPIGSFESYLFYKGQDITAKVTPKGFPSIAEVRFADNLIYLSFGDYGTFRRHAENRYASYSLLTGELKID